MSSGFDAAKDDVGNAKHDRPGNQGIDLDAEDYAWVTERIQVDDHQTHRCERGKKC